MSQTVCLTPGGPGEEGNVPQLTRQDFEHLAELHRLAAVLDEVVAGADRGQVG